MTLSKQLANYIVQMNYEQIPKPVIEFTKLCILDYYASLLKGIHEQPPQIIEEVVRLLGGNEQATAASGYRTTITNATLINGGASHVIELDDIHKASIVHAATVIMPAAIAVAEWQKCSGKELLTAIIAGYEVAFRIGEAVTPAHYYFFHNTATVGTFGATAAVCKLLNCTESQIVHALGSAGTQAAGLWEFIEDGAMSKQLHPGNAGVNGIISTLLALQGFTGASKILEGKRGFLEAMVKTYDQQKITEQLGETFKITENAFKIHASCRHTHAAIDLALQLAERNDFKSIQSIEVKTYEAAAEITNNNNPTTIYAAKFSMQFCVALALSYKNCGYDAFNAKTLNDPSICKLMTIINVTIDPTITEQYPEVWGTKLVIQFQDGTEEILETKYPKGDPENPLTKKDFIEKFSELCPLPQEKQEEMIRVILAFENYEVKDLIHVIYQ